MTTNTEELDAVYAAKSPEETRKTYNQWAESYDADNLSRGFRLPVLDVGCGKCLAGEALLIPGFGPVTSCDLLADMLAAAEKPGV